MSSNSKLELMEFCSRSRGRLIHPFSNPGIQQLLFPLPLLPWDPLGFLHPGPRSHGNYPEDLVGSPPLECGSAPSRMSQSGKRSRELSFQLLRDELSPPPPDPSLGIFPAISLQGIVPSSELHPGHSQGIRDLCLSGIVGVGIPGIMIGLLRDRLSWINPSRIPGVIPGFLPLFSPGVVPGGAIPGNFSPCWVSLQNSSKIPWNLMGMRPD